MNKNNPSVLSMPQHKKDETIAAVYQAINILGEQAKESRECWSESWKTTSRATTHTITMVNNSRKYISAWVSLVVGSSQQRRLERYGRRSDVWHESRRIADQTGANFEEVKKLYLELMNSYIDRNL